jgi:hypothetical protein
MDRSYASGAAGSAPVAPASPSIGYPTAGNPGTGTPATKPGPYWYHQITEELLAIITAAGITPAQGALTQLASAIQSGKLFSSVAGGTADALTAVFTPAVTALTNGISLYIRAASANTTTSPTFKADGTASKVIVKGSGTALASGDIAGGGHWIELQFDQVLDKWVLLNPATGVSQGYFCAVDEKSQNTPGGSSIAGVQTRTLSALRGNTISGATLASNQITLPAGSFRIRALAPAVNVDGHRAYLYNVTDAIVALNGTSENTSASTATDGISTVSHVFGRLSIVSAKVFELRHYTASAVTTAGLGYQVNNGGNEVYSVVEIVKE